MAYHPLTTDTGGQTPERRREEADDLVARLSDHVDELSDQERYFVELMAGGYDSVSPKQLLWLRDLWGRFA